MVKDPSAIWETQVQSLDWEYPLEKGYSGLENSMDREHGKLQSMGLQRIGHD